LVAPDKALFESMPVPLAIAKSALPAIASMLLVLLYNIADTFFVGQTGDPLQIAAVALATPVFMLFMATGTLFGIGGTSVISRALGAKRLTYARQTSAFCFYASLLSGALLMPLFWLGMPMLLALVGASEATADFTRDYLLYVAPSAPFVILATAFSNIVRAEGKVIVAMGGMMLGTLVNILLDPLLILGLDMGVVGAALATVIGNAIGAAFYLLFFLRKRSALSIDLRDLRVGQGIASGVLTIGITAAINPVLMSISFIVLNNLLIEYGDIELAAMGIAQRVALVVIILQLGVGISIQPLLGYSYGAGNRNRFNELIRVSLVIEVVMGTALTLAVWFAAGSIVRAFIDNPQVYESGVAFLRAMILSGPIVGLLFVFANALQAVGAAAQSLLISVSRQGLVFLPLLLLLNAWVGMYGIVYTQPVADLLSVLLAGGVYLRVSQRLWQPSENRVPELQQLG